jgi:hypothetical protein
MRLLIGAAIKIIGIAQYHPVEFLVRIMTHCLVETITRKPPHLCSSLTLEGKHVDKYTLDDIPMQKLEDQTATRCCDVALKEIMVASHLGCCVLSNWYIDNDNIFDIKKLKIG